jgi:hypothetical protein
VPATFIIGIIAVFAWGVFARAWLPGKGVALLRERWSGLPRMTREFQRQAFALAWAMAQTAVLNVMVFSMGIGDSLAAGTNSAFPAWIGYSLLGFVLGYLWFIVVSFKVSRHSDRPA